MLDPGPAAGPVLVRTQPVAGVRPAAAPGDLLAQWLAEASLHDTSLQPRLLRRADGRLLPLHVDRWAGPVTSADETLLARARGPVLDVGCGPGRLTAALHRRGTTVLGLDVLAPVPVLARQAGAPVHLASVFDPLPGEGTWRTVLLADGNLGIGGDPAALLRRARDLLVPGGEVLCELEADAPSRGTEQVRLEGLGSASEWFPWALVGPEGLADVAAAAEMAVRDVWRADGRVFAALDPAT